MNRFTVVDAIIDDALEGLFVCRLVQRVLHNLDHAPNRNAVCELERESQSRELGVQLVVLETLASQLLPLAPHHGVDEMDVQTKRADMRDELSLRLLIILEVLNDAANA